MYEIECEKFKSCPRGYFLGFADFYVGLWKLEIKDCKLYSKEGKRWINFPQKEYFGENDEKKYSSLIRFRERDDMDGWTKEAKQAIDTFISSVSENMPSQENAPGINIPGQIEPGQYDFAKDF